ncbi:hypothetical protein O7635_05340 [Asanoa sp. WMMD1127]|uniref:hypothetical protein n=1 Tax=Asanoa sp. WMMD1127 TaxID=3016107 RepID=UPI0024168701|nr:hypothetical protein [Asanoa sp. WMMD1127]MDG4821276.1 hypothetical protein [Asanoa sp. WMMD1127]
MTVRACSPIGQELPVNGVWVIDVAVRDADGALVDVAPVVTITLPAGSTATPTPEALSTGVYRVLHTVSSAGRYIARAVAAGYGAADFAAQVDGVTAGTGMPSPADLSDYMGPNSHTEEDMQSALDAEAASQRAVCRVGAVYPADLREALLRRAARNLALRSLPAAMETGDGQVPTPYPMGYDPEIRRLERPHRKLRAM